MTAATLTLYGEPFGASPYVFSCFVALQEKGLPFEVVTLDLSRGEHRRSPYVDRAPTARVPALAHGDFWLTESSAIVEYLEDVFPAPGHPALLPADPLARARARQLLAWIRSDLGALRVERATTTMFYAPATTALSPAGAEAAETLIRVAASVVPATSPHLFGAWSIADADLAFMLHRLILNGHPLPPRIAEWAAAEWRRPSVQAFVTHAREPFRAYE